MSERGILAFGAYIPRRRLPRKTIADAMAWVNPAMKAQGKRRAGNSRLGRRQFDHGRGSCTGLCSG